MYLNQSDLLAEISEKTGYTRKELKLIFDVLKDLVYEHVRKNDTVRLFKGVLFQGKRYENMTVKNPQTGEWFVSEPFTRVKVYISRNFRDYVR